MSFNKIINVTSDSSNYGAIIQNAPICRLPVDLFFKILEQLDPATVNKVCSSICKQFNIILSSTSYDRIWSDVFCLHFPNEKINDIKNFSLAYKNKIFTLSN